MTLIVEGVAHEKSLRHGLLIPINSIKTWSATIKRLALFPDNLDFRAIFNHRSLFPRICALYSKLKGFVAVQNVPLHG